MNKYGTYFTTRPGQQESGSPDVSAAASRVIKMIGEGVRSKGELLSATGLDEATLGRVMEYLITNEMVEQQDDGFRLSTFGRRIQSVVAS